MKKIIAIVFVMVGICLTSCKSSIILGKAVGELATVPLGITVGACEGFVEGCCEGADYLVNGDTTTITSYKTATYTQSSSAPVYVVPSQNTTPGNKVSIINSPGAKVDITESTTNATTTTTRTPTVIYVPSSRPNYYLYRGW